MTAIDASPKLATPFKPRSLWRGSLLLPDGTALPGIAFVSNVPPAFTSQPAPIRALPANGQQTAKAASPPLTLSREQQDALSLSIEMVRHAPITISEVIEDVEKDTDGTLLRPKRLVSSAPAKEKDDKMHVSYQAAGGVRMYVDPAYPSSVAYMERVFCYEADEVEDEGATKVEDSDAKLGQMLESSQSLQEATKQEVCHQAHSSSSVIVLSLDRSYRYSLAPRDSHDDDNDDVFSADCTTSVHTLQSSSNEAIEAVIIGVRGTSDTGAPHLELHVGQKVIRKIHKRENGNDEKGRLIGPRPDDPAPRGLSRLLSARYSSTKTEISRQPSLPSISLSNISPQFVCPAVPSADSNVTKRLSIISIGSNDDRSSSMPILKRSAYISIHQEPNQIKRSKSMMSTLNSTTKTDEQQKIEENNRSLIKKLVHHQLLGKGIEKKDEEYLKCFNPTCNGTALALRRQFKTGTIDRAQAASIIEKHLDMYL